ncbi:MAG: DUF4369 domain-containing protein, partial [Ferruginibacter sp.]|nr:DUF4369 domain-containing protein [Ferruginibacter sp.]
MSVRKLMYVLTVVMTMISCKGKKNNNEFTVSGNIENAKEQKVYLEQLFFSTQDIKMVDSGKITNGQFKLKGIADEEGLYVIRLEKNQAAYFLVNDINEIKLNADVNKLSLEGFSVNTPVNLSLKTFMSQVEKKGTALQIKFKDLDSLKNANDQKQFEIESLKMDSLQQDFIDYASQFADTTTSPVLALYSLGYLKNYDMSPFMT